MLEYANDRYKDFPESHRDSRFLRLYGITLDEYEERLAAQGGVCARCGQEPGQLRLAVDHCHVTGAVRGLLCGSCNTYLGRLEANVDRLVDDLRYLQISEKLIDNFTPAW